VPLETCMERNRRRQRVVPEEVMHRMAGKLRPPTFEEGFAKIVVVRVRQKPPADAGSAPYNQVALGIETADHQSPEISQSTGSGSGALPADIVQDDSGVSRDDVSQAGDDISKDTSQHWEQ